MRAVLLAFELILLIWFFGCIVTYRIGGHTLVEGMGVRSLEFVMFAVYAAGVAASLVWPHAGQWAVTAILSVWLAIQFCCHWYYTVFGVSERKLKSYNECFKDTVRLFPKSDKVLIPDLYHILLHLLIILNITLSLIYLLRAS